MAQRLRELVTLPEDPGSISSILHGSSQLSESPVPEYMTPEYMSQDIYAGKTPVHIK